MKLKKLEKDELRKALVSFVSQESIGGNAGPYRACANAFVDEEGNILGFSNYPEDRAGYQEARIIFNYEEMFTKFREDYKKKKTGKRYQLLSKLKGEYRLPYAEKIIYEGPNKEKVIKNIERALKEAGYRFKKT
ncbi:MAG: hypothetical protein N3G19_01905 [Candidatus Pacearchaeota archaeon]|nr:hypothetical protein [Candidatus Pacearchaeota archaeon]